MAYKDKKGEIENKKRYYQENRDKILQEKKNYYQKNKERIQKRTKLYGKEWYQKNKKRIRLHHKEYYKNNKEKVQRYHKKWYRDKKEKITQQSKDYYQRNREKIRLRHRKYNQENRERIMRYKGGWQKFRRRTDPKYRLDENMHTAIWASLKDKKAMRKWETLVGYTLEDLAKNLEKQFDDEMDWNNYGSYWSVDHIKPKSLFNYTSPYDSEFKQCWALKNLKPLEKIENIKKGNRYIG